MCAWRLYSADVATRTVLLVKPAARRLMRLWYDPHFRTKSVQRLSANGQTWTISPANKVCTAAQRERADLDNQPWWRPAVDVVDLQAVLHREMLARASLPCGDRHQCALETGPYPCLVTLAVHALTQDAEN